jgi:hypothetical protein
MKFEVTVASHGHRSARTTTHIMIGCKRKRRIYPSWSLASPCGEYRVSESFIHSALLRSEMWKKAHYRRPKTVCELVEFPLLQVSLHGLQLTYEKMSSKKPSREGFLWSAIGSWWHGRGISKMSSKKPSREGFLWSATGSWWHGRGISVWHPKMCSLERIKREKRNM